MAKKKKTSSEKGEGAAFFDQIGQIFLFVGLASFLLLGFVSLLPQDYEKYNVPLCFGIWAGISFLFVVIGVIPLFLGKYSKKYRAWTEKEIESYGARRLKRIERSVEKELRKRK